MAGVAIKLRSMMRKDTLSGMAQTYSYASLIASGPCVISIIAILIIGLKANAGIGQALIVQQFQVSVSYLMAGSLILTSPLQIVFTRYAADRMFENRHDIILPNLMGALSLSVLFSVGCGIPILYFWFEVPFIYRLCMLTSFVVLSCIWMLQILASAIRAPHAVVVVFAAGYMITIGAALGLRDYGLAGLLTGFIGGQLFMLFLLLAMIVREFPADRFIAFSFLKSKQIFPSLALTGLLYNLGVWSDKFIFWADSITGAQVIASLRASPIYDLPVFLAYLSILPGMAIFFVRIEVEVAEQCEEYFRTVTRGGTHAAILQQKQRLVGAIARSLIDIAKVQAIATFLCLLFGNDVLHFFGMSQLYRPLLNVDLVAVAMQLLILAMLSFLFYLDRRRLALVLCLVFFLANAAFSIASLYAGPLFYGYGFAAAVLLTAIVGALLLSRTFHQLEYETFMLQPARF